MALVGECVSAARQAALEFQREAAGSLRPPVNRKPKRSLLAAIALNLDKPPGGSRFPRSPRRARRHLHSNLRSFGEPQPRTFAFAPIASA